MLGDFRIDKRVAVLALDGSFVGSHEPFVLSDGDEVEQHDSRRPTFAFSRRFIVGLCDGWYFQGLRRASAG